MRARHDGRALDDESNQPHRAAAARALQRVDLVDAFLVYPQFDVTRYPQLEAVLTAQGIDRPAAIRMPYFSKPKAST